MGAVTTERRGNIAILTIDNPPVNALGSAVRSSLAEAVQAALEDDGAGAVVLTGAGRMFSGGADIQEFGKEYPAGVPSLPDLITTIEAASKPVIAAIHGVAAGGGLEVALGCHWRLAAPGTRMGLPEVTLGILPGAGGTQRLPRVIGVEAALQAIVAGDLMPVEKALALGLVDENSGDDLVADAVAYAEKLVAAGTAPRRTGELEDKIAEARGKPDIFEDFRQGMARRARGFEAPYACVESVEAAVSMPFAEGLANERQMFARLVASDQSKALRHAFFAEREVAKIPDVPKDTATQPIKGAAVIGAGTMGGGIAMNFANAGIPVTVIEANDAALEKGLGVVRKNYASTVAKGRLSQDDMDTRMGLISGSTEYRDVADADIVIEAAFEDMLLKKEIFQRLDQVCGAETIITTNTSSLDVDEIAAVTARPEKVMGTHFFSPANVMKLVEIVRGRETAPDVLATCQTLARGIGKIPVVVGVCHGFVGNRMLAQRRREADRLVLEGALPWDVDRVLYDFGFPMGPFAMSDLAGLDIGWQKDASTSSTLREMLCERGRFGQKSGSGYYVYDSKTRASLPDPGVEGLIRELAQAQNIERREVSHEEILERCLYSMVLEGAKILEEKIAARGCDIDVIWVNGYGWPVYRGGPMYWADSHGLDQMVDRCDELAAEIGDEWQVPALLRDLATQGRRLSDSALARKVGVGALIEGGVQEFFAKFAAPM